jgi:enamine deaminase RidA (YjgF/YER057c/UK114 family)
MSARLLEPACLQFGRSAGTAGPWLGGALYGGDVAESLLVEEIGADAAAVCARIDVEPLSGSGFAELWRVGGGPLRSGRSGDIQWCANESLLYAHVSIDEAGLRQDAGCALEPAAQKAYSALFALLDASGYPHPVRFWNYLPRINVDEDGLERYRHFNVGRHAAFVSAHRPTDASPPAACALGCDGGSLVVMVLAARRPAVAIENPRQVSAYRYPAKYGPKPPTFSRAALYREGRNALLFISGTASIVGHETLHPGDVESQVDESLRNIDAVVAAANEAAAAPLFTVDGLQLKAYVRDAVDAAKVARRLALRMPGHDIPLVRADICRASLLFEIEGAGAVRPDAGS